MPNMAEEGYIFERCFVTTVSHLALKKFKNYSEFSRKAFPDNGAPVNKWRVIRNGLNERCRSVTVADAYCIAAALGMGLDELVWKVKMTVSNGWDKDKEDVFVLNDKTTRPNARASLQRAVESSGATEEDVSKN